ncbi:C6 finger domain protein, putative [Talaromyces stipitatus ATCC 10500]|uniref:C6 finger domain protein, putative n=1 Tax=Talaromyces stipitatus (strain ATCC 10500 / CBS 375.48 / QM 6759 / NRRL 1006) TaxID=441959 RepID=B8M755_TALSN|nr:C6 finger domain protein, putative [Talaromyces stipitatus ATCC 10500]EED20275.1 C6 finger domain protein, putative [Talaromyces stipitatus ATCC 10500]
MASNNNTFSMKDNGPKRHAACDECRNRKLKCSGEQTGCRRCTAQGLYCHYSIQKQMGRPRKKQKLDGRRNDNSDGSEPRLLGAISDIEKEWTSADLGPDTTLLCPQVYLSRYGGYLPSKDVLHFDSSSLPQPPQLQPIAATIDPWPDFSTTSASASMLSNVPSSAALGEDAPTCPCLSYLYLCLSTLSSLNSFSINRETTTSLCTAARTAQSVIRCEICPLRFATGMQNVMMLGTLLSVMADAWYKISLTDASTLGRELASPEFKQLVMNNKDPHAEELAWNHWLRRFLRRAIIGTPIDPKLCPPTAVHNITPDLYSLIRELEDRQRYWHAVRISHPTNPFDTLRASYGSVSTPPSSTSTSDCSKESNADANSSSSSTANTTGEGVSTALPPDPAEIHQNAQEHDYLCLKIVGAAKHVIKKFEFGPEEYPEGVPPILLSD